MWPRPGGRGSPVSGDLRPRVTPGVVPPLDPGFRPAALFHRAYVAGAEASPHRTVLRLGLQRPDGSISTYAVPVVPPAAEAETLRFAERLLKFLLWQRGAATVLAGGPREIGEHLARVYSADGARRFDAAFMATVFDVPFEVRVVDPGDVPDSSETAMPLGRHLDGNRIGFDLGASDYKVSAVAEGEVVFADEFPWQPGAQRDPGYHYDRITEGLRIAASHLPSVDAIGGSAAGVWIDDQVRVASLFRGLSPAEFEAGARGLFLRIRDEWGVPLNVVNDGEVTALAGSMSLEANAVLGVAMGSSEAAGYVTPDGSITGWLNELAFAPIDYARDAPADEWSGDVGCGVQYLCQTGVVRLAGRAGIDLDPAGTLAQRLAAVQALMDGGDAGARPIFETVGVWLGYALAYYAEFYDVAHVLVLGRVTSGRGGDVIVAEARRVLDTEFPDLALALHVPDERMRRVGQSVAAASLPRIEE